MSELKADGPAATGTVGSTRGGGEDGVEEVAAEGNMSRKAVGGQRSPRAK